MLQGSCLCGATRIRVRGISRQVGACHCNMCRKWGGGPLLAVDCGTDVSFEGEENISVFESSAWAERGFCNRCGATLFWQADGKDYVAITAGTLDTPSGLKVEGHIFCADKGDYYEITDGDYQEAGTGGI